MTINGRWKIPAALWLCLALSFIFYKGVLPGWSDTSTDFNNYYSSAALWLEGTSIHDFYDNDDFATQSKNLGIESGAKFAPFPPPSVILYTPLVFWKLLTAKRIWLTINLALLILVPFRLRHYFNASAFFSASILSIFFVPLASNLHFGQFYLIATFLLIEAVGLSQFSPRSKWPGIVIGILATVKYLPVLFTLYLFRPIEKKWRPILTVSLTIMIITSAFLLLDPAAYTAYFDSFSQHLNGNLDGQGKFAIGFQSIDALLNLLFVFDKVENPAPILHLPILKPILKAGFILTVFFGCFWLFRKENYRLNTTSISIFMVGSFLIIPASASYHFLLLLLPIFLIMRWLVEQEMIHVMIVIILSLAAFSVQHHHMPDISSSRLINLIIHFPRLWFIMALFGYLLTIRTKSHG